MLKTERLIVREYTGDDAADFFRLNSDPEVMRYVPDQPMKTVEEARAVIVSRPMVDYRERGFGRWACITKSTGEHIGFCGLKFLPEINGIDLGFRFLPVHWGKGLATEAGKACVDYGFNQLGLEEIFGFAEPENHASIRVLQKVGMQFVDEFRLLGCDMRRYVIRRERHAPL
ncbi:MAG TPA: GNAT family N-acetyltransferase [Chthoniobacterales bacterium]|nr:GNAT family N-acetyltransferase [Chthoniobacterales bacterium]